MRIALPTWRQRISPVLDTATRCQLVDVENGIEVARREAPLDSAENVGRAAILTGLGVNVVICCAISRHMQVELETRGVQVLMHTCGAVEEVLTAFLQDRLAEEAFRMPGCRRLPECVRGKKSNDLSARSPHKVS